MTAKAVDHVEGILQREGAKNNKLQMPLTGDSEMVSTVLRSAAVIVAAPTYEQLFPPVAAALNELGRKRITARLRSGLGHTGGRRRRKSSVR